MYKLDHTSGKPLYEQIRDNLKKLIIDGVLKPDEKRLSVRELAVEMTINPNTIQKAYKDLENEGLTDLLEVANSCYTRMMG